MVHGLWGSSGGAGFSIMLNPHFCLFYVREFKVDALSYKYNLYGRR